MGKFGHLKRFSVRGREASVSVPCLGPDAKIRGRPATESNPAWLQRGLENPSLRGEGIRSPDALARAIDEVCVEFSKVVLTGWEGVCDQDGKLVEFSQENALDLMRALPPQARNELIAFFKNDMNFVSPDSIGAVEERSGN